MAKSSTVRRNLYLSPEVVGRVEEFASRNSISTSRGAELLLQLGLDAELSGAESMIAISNKLSSELNSLRGLVVASIDAADTSCALQLSAMGKAGLIKQGDISHVFSTSRKHAKNQIKQMKKSTVSPPSPKHNELLEGLED